MGLPGSWAVLFARARVDHPAGCSASHLSLAEDASRFAFISDEDESPVVGNPDRSWEAFLYDLPAGPPRQITNGPKGAATEFEIDHLTQSLDGSRLAFSSRHDLDPTAATGGQRQAFVYTDETGIVRQMTGRDGTGDVECTRPTLDATGATLACEGDGLLLVDVASGFVERVANQIGNPATPRLSSDGALLAFIAELDLDPTVGNEDLTAEIFLLGWVVGPLLELVIDAWTHPYWAPARWEE